MLAAQAEEPPEDGEAAQARGRLHEPTHRSVERIALHDARDPDRDAGRAGDATANRHGPVRPKPRSSKTSPASPATCGLRSVAPTLGTAASTSKPEATAVPANVKVTHQPASSQRSSKAKSASAPIVTSPLRSATPGAPVEHAQLRGRQDGLAAPQRTNDCEHTRNEGDLRGEDDRGKREHSQDRIRVRIRNSGERRADEGHGVDGARDREGGEGADGSTPRSPRSELGREGVRNVLRRAEASAASGSDRR